jgi:transcriptional regulator of arginine metabolism
MSIKNGYSFKKLDILEFMSRLSFEDEVLVKLVKAKDYAEQADLQKALKSNGVDMPQATLSRRLKKLNIAKVNGIYQVVKQNTLNPIVKITEVAPNLLVINTLPGHANSIATIVDEEFVNDQLHGVSGSIAGDDTIFVAINPNQLEFASQQLKKFFQKDV